MGKCSGSWTSSWYSSELSGDSARDTQTGVRASRSHKELWKQTMVSIASHSPGCFMACVQPALAPFHKSPPPVRLAQQPEEYKPEVLPQERKSDTKKRLFLENSIKKGACHVKELLGKPQRTRTFPCEQAPISARLSPPEGSGPPRAAGDGLQHLEWEDTILLRLS